MKSDSFELAGRVFSSRLIVLLTVVAVMGLISAVAWELRHPDPIVNLRLLKERNFLVCSLIIFCAYASCVNPSNGIATLGALSSGVIFNPCFLMSRIRCVRSTWATRDASVTLPWARSNTLDT